MICKSHLVVQLPHGFITLILIHIYYILCSRRSAVDITFPYKLTPGFLALVSGYVFFKMLYNEAFQSSYYFETVNMEWIINSRGKNKVAYEGYIYTHQKQLANDVESYECERRRHDSCKCKVKVLGNRITHNLSF